MKAITLYQPWASLVAVHAKQFETRSWKTDYRGRIAIHAGKKDINDFVPWPSKFGLACALAFGNEDWKYTLPIGAVVATAELVGCYKIDSIQEMSCAPWETGYWKELMFHDVSELEILFGDWTPGRYAWELRDVIRLSEPIPAKGAQGLWTWEDKT